MTDRIYVRGSGTFADMSVFGSDEELFTPELVMRTQLNHMAETLHEIYRKSATDAPSWGELSEFLRQSNIASADHLFTKIRILMPEEAVCEVTPDILQKAYGRFAETKEQNKDLYRKAEHERWMRFHALHNWRYAEVRDNARRRHPLMRPYEELTEIEQAKDDDAWELLGALVQEMKEG